MFPESCFPMFANDSWTWIERNIDERGNVRGLCMVVLCVDQVVVHHCEKDQVEKECAEEVERVEDQTTRSESEKWCARITRNW